MSIKAITNALTPDSPVLHAWAIAHFVLGLLRVFSRMQNASLCMKGHGSVEKASDTSHGIGFSIICHHRGLNSKLLSAPVICRTLCFKAQCSIESSPIEEILNHQ